MSQACAENSTQNSTPASQSKPHLWGQRVSDLTETLLAMGVPEKKARYHSHQIFRWIYERKVSSYEEMTDISKLAREALAEKFDITPPLTVATAQTSTDGTRKFLFRLHDGNTVESVLIPANNGEADETTSRLTICISSQVGCAMGCKFCLTASMGLLRNLRVEEIVGQVLELSKAADITNIVFMGMGEPLHNLENVCRAVEILLSQYGMGFSKRKVTVSTSGLVPAIRKMNARLSRENRVNLAISLNGSFNEQREAVMPVNKAFPIEELLDACREFTLEPYRRITFEYVMMGGLNDTTEDAARVLKLLDGIPSKVNLIPYNPHPASPFRRSEDGDVETFKRFLLDRGVAAMVRHSRGRDILAACGQLKSAEDARAAVN